MKQAFCVVVAIASLVYSCPVGMIQDGPGRCLKFASDRLPFPDAENSCLSMGAHLVSINNASQNWLLNLNARTAFGGAWDFWIGANDLLIGAGWMWTDGTPFSYSNWSPGEPGDSLLCASSKANDGTWISSPCILTKPYVCLIKENVPVPETTTTQMTTTRPRPACAPSWTFFKDSCYKAVYKGKMDQLEDACFDEGAVLTSIHSLEENDFVTGMTRLGRPVQWAEETFIGMAKRGNTSWFWLDGTAVDFTNWAPGEPNNKNGQEFCVMLVSDSAPNVGSNYVSRWNDYPCSQDEMRAGVCKKDAAIQPVPVPLKPGCPPSWTYFSKTDCCYKAVYNGTMGQLENDCFTEDSVLTSIHSQEENDFVAGMTSLGKPVQWNDETFIGMAKRGNSSWFWLDGSEVQFTNWAPSEPNDRNGEEFCVMLVTDPGPNVSAAYTSRWNDYPCSQAAMRAGVCKKKPYRA